MYSEHFIRRGANGEHVALFIVDTQGLFDNETTMGLTAAIFGMSTLLSSYSIYNVSKVRRRLRGRERKTSPLLTHLKHLSQLIGEDALQHLALFSEYGRMALNAEEDDSVPPSYSPSTTTEKPFQKVEFLVRDWQNFDNDDPQTDEDFEEVRVLERCQILASSGDLPSSSFRSSRALTSSVCVRSARRCRSWRGRWTRT